MKEKKSIEEMVQGATQLDTTSQKKGGAGKASISIVNSEENGKRVSLSKTLIELLENPKTIQFLVADEERLLIGEHLGEDYTNFSFSKEGGRIIYSSSLVNELVKRFEIDYTDRVSASFDHVKVRKYKDYPVAIVKMK